MTTSQVVNRSRVVPVVVRSVVLLAVWVALWGELTVANVVSGIVVVALLAVVAPPSGVVGHVPNPVAMVVLGWHVLVDLIVSSLTVARAVVRPTPERTATVVLPVPLSTRSPLVVSIVANAITLTPGTMTVDVDLQDAFVLHVHVLGAVDADEFREGIALLERRVAAAVGREVQQP